jgi:hypothetical protein
MYIELKALIDHKQVPTYMTVAFVVATLGRISIALGLTLPKSLKRPHPLRRYGATLTYLSGFLLSVFTVLI